MVGCLLPQYNSHSNILFFSAANQIEHEIGEEENEEYNIGNQKRGGIFSGILHSMYESIYLKNHFSHEVYLAVIQIVSWFPNPQ